MAEVGLAGVVWFSDVASVICACVGASESGTPTDSSTLARINGPFAPSRITSTLLRPGFLNEKLGLHIARRYPSLFDRAVRLVQVHPTRQESLAKRASA